MLIDRAALERATIIGVVTSFLISLFALVVTGNQPATEMPSFIGQSLVALVLTFMYSFGGFFYGALYGAFAAPDNPEMTTQDYVGGGALTGSLAQGIGALLNAGLSTLWNGVQENDLLMYAASVLIPIMVLFLIGFVLGSFGGRVYAAMYRREPLTD